MLDWLKNINREYPEFWKAYLGKFEHKEPKYIAIHIKTTGFNVKKDVILSIGALTIAEDAVYIGQGYEVTIPQYRFLHDNGLSNDFVMESEQTKLSESQAIEKCIDFIGSATLVGYRLHNGLDILNEALEKMGCGRLKNEAIDIEIMYQKLNETMDKKYSLADICQAYKLNHEESNTTTEYAYTIALLFFKLKTRLGFK
jgi:DNA polymerase-3 subunit epsilon